MSEKPSNTCRTAICGKREFARLAVFTLLAAVVLLGLGYFPTLRVGGAQALPAMFVGVLISAVATLLGLIPAMTHLHAPPLKRHSAILMGMTVRLIAAILLTTAVALGAGLPYKPLLLWVAIAYMGLLAVDTFGVARLMKTLDRTDSA